MEIGVEVVQDLEVASIEKFDLPADYQFVWMHGRHPSSTAALDSVLPQFIRFGPASAPYVERNVFHTVERPHRLVYASTTEWSDGSRVESLMEISLQWLDA